MSRLLITQPYIPAYRVPFFRKLREELEKHGVDLLVASCLAVGASAARDDDATLQSADIILSERRVSLAGRSLGVRKLGRTLRSIRPDLIIMEQAIKNLELYPVLARNGRLGAGKVAMWGQGQTYSTLQSGVEVRFKQWLTCRSDWFFAYTEEGADYVVSCGFDRFRTTVVGNTLDTEAIRSDLQSISSLELQDFRSKHGLTPGHVGLFLGGVDSQKGIDFLLASLERITALDSRFVLLVAGAGSSSGAVAAAEESGRSVRYLGRLEGRAKALALKATDVLMIPNWVGLVAVDSLAAGRPIVTTTHHSHSPEFGYLSPGETAVVADHDTRIYANAVVDLLSNPDDLSLMQGQALKAGRGLTIQDMAARFSEGVINWSESRKD